jgi:hypothetical protein
MRPYGDTDPSDRRASKPSLGARASSRHRGRMQCAPTGTRILRIVGRLRYPWERRHLCRHRAACNAAPRKSLSSARHACYEPVGAGYADAE